jgi:GTP-binding protein Era
VQIIFVDTPGMHKGTHRFNKAMLDAASSVLAGKAADVIAYIVDLYRDLGDEEDLVADVVIKSGIPTLVVFNKIDMCPDVDAKVAQFYARYPALVQRPSIRVSAKDEKTRDLFVKALTPLLPVGPALFPSEDLTDENMRYFAAEYLQKGIILSTREEVPHACFVEINQYKEEEDRHIVEASIHVETEGQKGIIIGKGGKMIGKIRGIAEHELSRLAGLPVSYRIHIQVTPKWRDDARFIKDMGYGRQ